MMVRPGGGEVKVRLITASLAAALLLAPGCRQDEEEATPKRPPNPVPRADLGLPVQPKRPASDEGGESKGISRVEKDLRKDLGGAPVIKSDAPTTPTTPPAPDGAKASQP